MQYVSGRSAIQTFGRYGQIRVVEIYISDRTSIFVLDPNGGLIDRLDSRPSRARIDIPPSDGTPLLGDDVGDQCFIDGSGWVAPIGCVTPGCVFYLGHANECEPANDNEPEA